MRNSISGEETDIARTKKEVNANQEIFCRLEYPKTEMEI
jgi:hypothetical protein